MIQHHYQIPYIPDSNHYRYTSLSSGDVKSIIFERSEQLLRMISRCSPGTITFGIRGLYDPKQTQLQERLKWFVSVYGDENLSETALNTLVSNGPLSNYYDFQKLKTLPFDYEEHFSAVSEILRFEETQTPYVEKRANRAVTQLIGNFKSYYSVRPFKPRNDNDQLLLDQSLSQLKESVLIEVLVSPKDTIETKATLFKYLSQLLDINAYDDSTYVPGQTKSPSVEYSGGIGSKRSFSSNKPQKAKDPLADDYRRDVQDMLKNIRESQLQFSIKVYATEKETTSAIASTFAEASFENGIYQMLTAEKEHPRYRETIEESQTGCFRADPISAVLFSEDVPPDLGRLRKLSRIGSPGELLGAFRLPVAGSRSPRCMSKSTDPGRFNKEKNRAPSILLGYDLEMGIPPDTDDSNSIDEILRSKTSSVPRTRFSQNLLNKHLFISGASGSGKTTTVFNLLIQLYRNGIPFLVIEPAKSEYRILKSLINHTDEKLKIFAKALQIITPGNENISPLRFNPLAHDSDISRDEHIGNLINCFKAAIPMFGPLEAIISDALEAVYQGLPANQSFPTMKNLVHTVKVIMDQKGYEGEVKSNITAAVETRLDALTKRSIGKIFSSESSMPDIKSLLSTPTIIELDYLNNETASLLTLFILSAIRTEIRQSRTPGSDLKHFIILEEAHNLVGSAINMTNDTEVANPKAHAAEFISRMLAEVRSLGEGIALVDQLPSAVAPEVVKNTGIKIAGRLLARDDREFLGATMLLNGEQINEMARLPVGEAYVYHEDLHSPRRTKSLNAEKYLNLKDNAAKIGDKILPQIKDDPRFQKQLAIQVLTFRKEVDDLHEQARASQSKLFLLIEEATKKDLKKQEIADLIQQLEKLKDDLITLYERTIQNQYDFFFDRVDRYGSEKVQESFITLSNGINDEIIPGISKIITKIETTIEQLNNRLKKLKNE